MRGYLDSFRHSGAAISTGFLALCAPVLASFALLVFAPAPAPAQVIKTQIRWHYTRSGAGSLLSEFTKQRNWPGACYVAKDLVTLERENPDPDEKMLARAIEIRDDMCSR